MRLVRIPNRLIAADEWLARATLATSEERVNQLLLGLGTFLEIALDGLDQQPPLGLTGDHAESLQARFHVRRDPQRQLLIVGFSEKLCLC